MVLALTTDTMDLNVDYPLDRYGEWFFGVGAPSAPQPADGSATQVAIIDSVTRDIDIDEYIPGETLGIDAKIFQTGGESFYSAENGTSRVFPLLLGTQTFRARFEPFDIAAQPSADDVRFREVVAYPMPLEEAAFTGANLSPFLDEGASPLLEGANPRSIVVVIDDAINPLHHRFRDADGKSRVDFAWDMSFPWDDEEHTDVRVPFGREWSAEDLNNIITSHADDEAAQLRAIRFGDRTRSAPNPSLRRVTHGTHVADLATGGLGAEDRIIAISLPPVAVGETSGGLLGAMLVFALEYALQRLGDLLGDVDDVPVLFNLSLATNGGPRDGTHLVTLAMDDVVKAYPWATFVLPSGNQFQSAAHVSVPARNGTAHLDVGWTLRSGDRSANFVEFWLPEMSTSLMLRLQHPIRDEVVEWELDPAEAMLLTDDGVEIGRVTFDGPGRIGNTNGRRRLLLAMQPTFGDGPLAPAGRWGLKLIAEGVPEGETIEGWIQRDGAPFGYPMRGKMSVFSDPAYRQRDDAGRLINETEALGHWPSQILRRGTISALASHCFDDGFQIVGGRFGRTPNGKPAMAPYSAASDQQWASPNVSAVTEDSPVLRGVRAAATRGRGTGRLSGTSVAVPQLVRKLATGEFSTPNGNGIDPLRDGLGKI